MSDLDGSITQLNMPNERSRRQIRNQSTAAARCTESSLHFALLSHNWFAFFHSYGLSAICLRRTIALVYYIGMLSCYTYSSIRLGQIESLNRYIVLDD